MEKVKTLLVDPQQFVTVGTSAPPRPLSFPAPTVSVDPGLVLDELLHSIDEVRAAILASVDGFAIASAGSVSDEVSHSAMLAAAAGLAHQLVAMGGGRKLRQLVVDHDGGLMIVWPIGDRRVLGVIAGSTVEQRRLRSFVQARAVWLAGEC